MKLYPAMDLLGGRVVRLHKGDYAQVTEYPVDPVALVADYVSQGATRVHIVDLDGAREGRATQAELIARVVRETGASVQVGGGIRSLAQAEAYVSLGVERVVLGTAAVRDKAFLREACRAFSVVVAVDARDGLVTTHGWTEATTVRAVDLAAESVALGACAVLYTDVARDGTGVGPNVAATVAIARAVDGHEVIASGGVGSLEHLLSLAREGVIASCVLGKALLEGRIDYAAAVAACA
ncbi:MAG: 1-(5-phosphoribosyl)-5-[(5-phosphoribosylamino)methylideneamino] imidazole-4-carboxamide isomerase [Deltaproteobacteria bacterium]|nr:1-(5-phosphoribosyl)-5-[(5-phosphoribosylamino)methylideneamino] imidazole-4-carboxamide isomerase [Deltaproteobacteria bacterium]